MRSIRLWPSVIFGSIRRTIIFGASVRLHRLIRLCRRASRCGGRIARRLRISRTRCRRIRRRTTHIRRGRFRRRRNLHRRTRHRRRTQRGNFIPRASGCPGCAASACCCLANDTGGGGGVRFATTCRFMIAAEGAATRTPALATLGPTTLACGSHSHPRC